MQVCRLPIGYIRGNAQGYGDIPLFLAHNPLF